MTDPAALRPAPTRSPLAGAPPVEPLAAARPLLLRTAGRRHGPITRLISPHELGEQLKPFVFLDAFDVEAAGAPRFGMHPHSGIATFSALISGRFAYEDTTGKSGVLDEGGVEWMRAGRGVWHDGAPASPGRIAGYQLWVALPPEQELAEPESLYLAPADVPRVGPARVLLGAHGGAQSPVPSPEGITYLLVELSDGEGWTFQPAPGQRLAFVAVHEGGLRSPAPIAAGELGLFAPGEQPLSLQAVGPTRFILGAARPHRHPLVTGRSSVHTTPEALAQGERRIREIGGQLAAGGRLG
ncbi:MAG: pirin family protein [Deltaproteobacteria bacterium]|nr:pirin family protein [Deltaproteobacteria bacterium]